jgi:DNA (cytosine-5)-methyltransferase 1
MNVLSLFSGVGGFDMGLEAAGYKTIFQCEWDKNCQKVLNKHWPDVPKWGDVSTLTGEHILRVAGPPDVVAWGSPCQDLSVAGKRKGLEGEKSGLFHEGIRIIKEIRELTNNEYPRISIWENVPGALSSHGGADFGVVLDEMAKAGALVVEWAVLDAQFFGVPQRRRRIFLAALFHLGDAERCGFKIFPVSESLPGNFAARAKKRKGTTAGSPRSVAASSQPSAFGNSGMEKWGDTELAITLSARDFKGGNTIVIEGTPLAQEAFTKSRHAKDAEDYETWVPGEVSPTLNTFENHQDTRATVAIVQPEALVIDGTRNDDVRVYDDGISPTLTHRMGTGGNNTPMIFDERKPNSPIVLDRAAFNQGPNAQWEPLMEEAQSVPALVARGPHAVLDTSGLSDEIVFEPGAMSRMKSDYYSDKLAPTLRANMGDNQPAVTQRLEVTPIQDGREIEKNQNGLGIGNAGDPAYTLDTTGAQAVAFSIREDAKANNFSATEIEVANALQALQPATTSHHAQTIIAQDGVPVHSFDTQFGSNAAVFENQSPTLKASQQSPSIAYVYDGYNQSLDDSGIHRSLRVGRDSSDFVTDSTMVVRRLTPLECERLMGWPENHTQYGAGDERIADTQRYKMCGNGVASPVAKWVGEVLLAIAKDSKA